MSQRTQRGGPAPAPRRRPEPRRSGFWRWLDYVTAWFGVTVLVLSFIVLAFPAALSVRDVLSGGQTSSAAIFQLVVFLAAEVVVVLMTLLAAYAAAPDRVRLAPATVRTLGTLSFGGMFFLILIVLSLRLYVAAVPVIVYFLRIRRSLADELPVFAGGRLQPQRKKPQRKEPRRDDVVRRPPRSWDEPDGRPKSKAGGTTSKAGSGQATGSGGRRGKKGRRPGAGGNRPKGR